MKNSERKIKRERVPCSKKDCERGRRREHREIIKVKEGEIEERVKWENTEEREKEREHIEE